MKNKLYFDSNGWIRKNFSDDEFIEICKLTPWIEDNQEPTRKSIRERVHCILNNITEIPKCKECGNEVKWQLGGKGGHYAVFCSKTCKGKSPEVHQKTIKTNLERYGFEHPAYSEIFKNKSIIKFGTMHPSQSKIVSDKRKITNTERYGVENTFQNEDFKEKIKATNLERYGVEFPMKLKEIRDKCEKTCERIYGVKNAFQSEQTNLTKIERYGKINLSHTQETKDKMSITKATNFQSRRNEEGTDYSGSVYILHFPQHNAVKIGLTGDFVTRSKDLISDFGEFSVIDIIETEECFKLESELHEKFAKYRICLDEGCGRTEFFNEEILNLL
jgi:hypothetical protein